MPLIHDPEYQAELDKLKSKCLSTGRFALARGVIGYGAILVIGFFVLSKWLSGSDFMGAMLILATLVLVATINEIGNALVASLAINAGAIEWVGRKQLGEYEPPE